MDRLIAPNSVDAAHADTAPATGTAAYATDGNPATGVPATLWPSYQYNAIQEELIAILAAAGITPDRTTNAQIAAAIKRLGQAQVLLADTGAANVYSAVNVPPLTATTWANGVVQQLVVAHTSTGASTYAPDGLAAIPIYGRSLQSLQQGEMFAGGVATLMKQTIAGVNGGNPIAVLMGCVGGTQQVPAAVASEHAAQLGQIAVFGGARNVKAHLDTAATSLTITADAVVVKSALNGIATLLTSFSQTVSTAAGTGAGKMDTGTAPVSGYVAVYASWGPVVGAGAFLQDATSTARGEQYGGANPPTGVTETQLIGVWPTNGSSQFIAADQADRNLYFTQLLFINTSGGSGTFASTSISGVVPRNANVCGGNIQSINSTAGNGATAQLAGTSTGAGSVTCSASAVTNGAGGASPFSNLPIVTAQTLYFTNQPSTGGSSTITAWLSSYAF